MTADGEKTMGKPHAYVLTLLAFLVVGGWFLAGGILDSVRDTAERPVEAGADSLRTGVLTGGAAAPGRDATPSGSARVAGDVVFTPEDVRIHRATVDWALENRLDTLPIGEIMVRTGRRFVGEPYTPHTLELPGPERLVVNLREFDCVTFVESMLALGRVIRDRQTDFDAFTDQLRRIRYRDGRLDGYASRLHYFSDWIRDHAESGLVEDVTRSLGGVEDPEAIDFMSTHVDAYPSFEGRPDRVAAIREIERTLSEHPRYFIPEERIPEATAGIRNGDVIAATSSVEGLDIAHTGLAFWRDGRLHLMHAPLVGRTLEVSEQPLAARIQRIAGQDGIMVARPL